MKTLYHKIMFYSPKHGRTAGIIITSDQLKNKSTAELSRMFPVSEFRKMTRLYVSRGFNTWNEAFVFQPPLSENIPELRES